MHDQQLHNEKRDWDRYCKSYLEELFGKSPSGPGTAHDNAEVAYAMLIGLRTAAFFDERLGPSKARRLFYSEMMSLAKLGEPG